MYRYTDNNYYENFLLYLMNNVNVLDVKSPFTVSIKAKKNHTFKISLHFVCQLFKNHYRLIYEKKVFLLNNSLNSSVPDPPSKKIKNLVELDKSSR